MMAGPIEYDADLNVLVSVRGHPFERDAFESLFEDMAGIGFTFVDQPAAASLMTPEGLAGWDVLLLYDMPGIDFGHPDQPGHVPAPDSLRAGLAEVLERGKGIVALHHAIAGWPAWPEYGDWLGGRFLYRPSIVHDKEMPDSGYRHDVRHRLTFSSSLDPALASLKEGLPDSFELTDELYLAPVFDTTLTPMLYSDYTFETKGFYSASLAVQGEMYSREGWSHPAGSGLIGWVKRAGNSPLVYLQPGDGPKTYVNPFYRRLVENAVRWAASDAAHAWARCQ